LDAMFYHIVFAVDANGPHLHRLHQKSVAPAVAKTA